MAVYILVAIVSVCLLAIYISMMAGQRGAMNRYIRCFLVFLAIHAAHAWVVRTFFGDNLRLDYYAPYGLLYGPFLYFAYQAAVNRTLSSRQLCLHGLPFFVFLIGYCVWLSYPSLFANHLHYYRLSLYTALTLSLLLYAVWALFFNAIAADIQNNQEVRLVSMMATVLAFIAAVFVVFTYSGIISGAFRSQFKGSIVYLTMLSAALILFSHIVNKVVHSTHKAEEMPAAKPAISHLEAKEMNRQPAGTLYQKSGIADEQLEAYEAAIRQLVERDQAYLNDNLSLESLAQLSRIPKHHLSQVFTLRIGMNFNTYINVHRVNHAIRLMHEHPEMNITDIYLNSGFTAKASFNRYFKQLEGCTPTEYRNRIT